MAGAEAGRRIVEAVVCTGGTETPYRRAGEGPPIVLLQGPPGPPDEAVFTDLSTEFRVIVPLRLPARDAGGEVWGSWLRGLIDGLGLERPSLVAHESFLPVIRRCAAVDPGRIRAVLDAGTGPARLRGQLRATLRHD